jgi:hypothetical protein
MKVLDPICLYAPGDHFIITTLGLMPFIDLIRVAQCQIVIAILVGAPCPYPFENPCRPVHRGANVRPENITLAFLALEIINSVFIFFAFFIGTHENLHLKAYRRQYYHHNYDVSLVNSLADNS